jgi:hypothetical protein
MESSITNEAMMDLLLNLYPPLTVDEIKKIMPKNSLEKGNDLSAILNELNSADASAISALFKALVLEKRGKFKD